MMSLQNRANLYGDILAIASRGAWMSDRAVYMGQIND
jgi:hypothetical protein